MKNNRKGIMNEVNVNKSVKSGAHCQFQLKCNKPSKLSPILLVCFENICENT